MKSSRFVLFLFFYPLLLKAQVDKSLDSLEYLVNGANDDMTKARLLSELS